MKTLLYTLLFCLWAMNTVAQTEANCDEKVYKDYLQEAKAFFDQKKYLEAVNAYSSALAICPKEAVFVKAKLKEVFVEINQLKEKAVKAEIATQTALTETEKQKQIADESLQKANKLINAFYFYEDRFALAFKDYQFYFIDKNGDKVERLGAWYKAEQFERTGFAKVKKQEYEKSLDYLIDTLGNSYRVAYKIEDLSPEIKALDLTGTQLATFPTEILTHSQLEVLILNGEYRKENTFKTLSAEIGKLQNLKNLQVQYCQLNSLPAQIGELKNLTSLDLSDNQLTSLPTQIGELKNLSNLNLSSSYFSNVGGAFTINRINKNQLSELPAQIGKLKNLTNLKLSNNQLTTLPTQIGKLENLQIVDLSYNKLKSIPLEIGELKNLDFLDLSRNELLTLPTQIGKLEKLQELDLTYNQLESLPPQIGELKNLQRFGLIGNDSLDWNSTLSTLKNISKNISFYIDYIEYKKNMQNNKLLIQIDRKPLWIILKKAKPEQISALKNLQELDLSYNQLKSLPPEIGELKNLDFLDLSSNELLTLPTQIGKLENLKELDLSYNQLKSLPPQIGELKNLQELYLRYNQLRNLPPQIGELKKLEYLELDSDFISEEEKEKIYNLLPNCEISFKTIDYYELANNYINKGNYLEAFENMKKAIQKDGTNYIYWFDLSFCALCINKPIEAIEYAQKSLSIKPDDNGVEINLAYGYLLNNEFEKAKKVFLENKYKSFSGFGLGKDWFLKGIDNLTKAGIKHPDFEKVKKLLE